jgi:tetratricopeptide (TPR) repeat protein
MLIPALDAAKLVIRHFRAHGWAVSETQKAQEDVCIAEKRDIKLIIRCVDQSFQKYRSVSHFVDRLRDFHTEYRNRSGEGIVYVTNRPILGLVQDSLLDLEVSLVLVEELLLLTSLERFYDEMLPPPEARERLLLKGCPLFCMAIADSCRSKGDLESAVQWLRMAMDETRIIRDVHYKLVDCYFQAGDFSAARASIEEILPLQPRNSILLEKLMAVELACGNPEAAKALKTRIAAIGQERPSFNQLIARQKISKPATRPPFAPPLSSQPTNTTQHWIKRILLRRE